MRFTRALGSSILFLLLFLAPLQGAETTPPPQGWELSCVECPHTFMTLEEQALQWDPAGRPHLAYGGDQLYHAWRDGAAWQIEVVDSRPGTGRGAALALDSQGYPHIVYLRHEGSQTPTLHYARWDGTRWGTQPVPQAAAGWLGEDINLALDADDRPHIGYSYYQSSTGEPSRMVYAYFDGAHWVNEVIGDNGMAAAPNELTLEIDRAGHAHIIYTKLVSGPDSMVGYLVHAVRKNGLWSEQRTDLGGVGVGYSSVLDGQGQLHLSYILAGHQEPPSSLRYSIWDGTQWQHQQLAENSNGNGGGPTSPALDGLGNGGGPTSLALDGQGHAHIAYYDLAGKGIYHATFTGSQWVHQAVSESQSHALSLALDGADTPLLAYFDQTELTLNAARWDGASWVSEQVDRSNYILQAALALDGNDHPHLTYQAYGGSLTYATLVDETWVRHPIDERGVSVSRLRLDAQGQPHVAYLKYDPALALGTVLFYARFDGVQWQREMIGQIGCYDTSSAFDLALDSQGQPHLIYCQRNELQYSHFDGQTWASQPLDAVDPVASGVSLVLDRADRPHLSYLGYTQMGFSFPFKVRYVMWDGASWVMQRFDEVTTMNSNPSAIALDGAGRPHIAYAGRYAYWDGSRWQIESVVEPLLPNYPPSPSLALDSQGRPHIGYTDGRYAYWNGQAWRIQTLGPMSGESMALALDRRGQPHLLHATGGDLYYARLDEFQGAQGPFRLYLPVAR